MDDPRQIRSELLAQHGEIRRLLQQASRLAEELLAGGAVEPGFEAAMRAFGEALQRHNRQEEAMLEPLLAGRDDWSGKRLARMREEHAAEHAALQASLSGLALEVAGRLAELSEDLDAHMAAEERTILNPVVLRGGD